MPWEIKLPNDEVVEVTEPTREDFSESLSGGMQFVLARGLYGLLSVTGEGIATLAGSFLVRFLEIIEPEIVKRTSPLVSMITSLDDVPDEITDLLQSLTQGTQPIDALLGGALASSTVSGVTSSVLGPLLSPITYGLNAKIRPARMSAEAIYLALWRGVLDQATADDWLKDQGWPDPAIASFKELLRPRPSIPDLLNYAYRKNRSPEGAKAELEKRGVSPEDMAIVMENAKVLPGVPDLIHMAVREAWDAGVVGRWGYDAGFPAEFGEWAERQGLDKDWAVKYWRAHWEVPSVTHGMEMVHRGAITEEEFKTLLRIADYPAGWRDAMLKTIYLPYTRVDVRRMFAGGVLSRADVKRAYLDGGYDDAHAENLTKWTENEYGEEEREVTKSDALGAYKEGIIDRGTLESFLTDLGYPAAYRSLLVSRADYAKTKALAATAIGGIKARYISGRIDRSGAIGALSGLNLPGAQIDSLIEGWSAERDAALRVPSPAQLIDMYMNDVISRGALYAGLIDANYEVAYANNFVALAERKKADALQDAQEAAAKEQERLRAKEEAERKQLERERLAAEKALARDIKAKAAELYRIAKALVYLDRERASAQLRTEIARIRLDSVNAELTIGATSNYDDILSIEARTDNNKARIASLQVDLAYVPLRYPLPAPQ